MSRRRGQNWQIPALVGGAIGIVVVILALCLVAMPFLSDWIVYSDVDGQCSGAFDFSGEVGGRSITGRHCFLGPDHSQNAVGFVDVFEIASGGRMLVYGDGQAEASEARSLRVALFRPPGEGAPWLCSGGGTYSRDKGEFVLDDTRVLIEEVRGEATLEVEVSASGQVVKGVFGGHKVGGGRLLGSSCLSGNRRCEVRLGHEGASVRVLMRTWIGMRTADHRDIPIEEGLVVFEDGLAPNRLRVAALGPESGSTVAWSTDSDLLTLRFEGLSEPVLCPAEGAGRGGEIEGDFDR